ncbi:MAG: hypothetical protein QGI52_01800 [Alphaproteobacteria bacterium]|nr:hypothetical protein [Alphaproteobacteria bacterium]
MGKYAIARPDAGPVGRCRGGAPEAALAAAFRLDFARPATHTPARHAPACHHRAAAIPRFDIRPAVRGMTA